MYSKRIIMAAVMLMLVFVVTGCFGDPVKSDLEAYMQFEMSNQQEAQEISLDILGKMNGAIQSKEEMLQAFNDTKKILAQFSEKQKNYKPKTKEVQDIHAKLLKQLELTDGVFSQIIELVNTENPTKQQVSNLQQKEKEIIQLAKEYQKDITTLAEQKKVEVKMKF